MTDTTELPPLPLPEPDGWRITDGEGDYNYSDESPDEFNLAWAARYQRQHHALFTADTLRAYAAEAVRVALENADALTHCGCGDQFTADEPGTCSICRMIKDRT